MPGGFFVCLALGLGLSRRLAADKAAVIPHFTSGNEVEIPRDLEEPPVVCWAGASPRGACHCKQSHPTTPNEIMRTPCQESGAATPHIQRCLQSLAICYIAAVGYLF